MSDTVFEHGTLVRRAGSNNSPGRLLYIHGLGESGLCFEHIIGHWVFIDQPEHFAMAVKAFLDAL